jgi:hypothetical protein
VVVDGVLGATGVDAHGFREPGGQRELVVEDPPLDIGRGVVAVEVQSQLADGYDLRQRGQRFELCEHGGRDVFRVVGMDPDRGGKERLARGELERSMVRRNVEAADRDSPHARLAGALKDRFERLPERRVLEVSMGVKQRRHATDPAGSVSSF